MTRRILVVSDNSNTRALISCKLESKKYDVIESLTPADAVERLKDGTKPPDLVIISLDMYETHTCGLIKRLRESPVLRFMPVLAVTDRDMLDRQLEWQMAGATCCLEKPFSGDDLLRLVEVLLF